MLYNIQALRAIAALNVVFFHIYKSATEYNLPIAAFSFIKYWGANGVDIFFVISGFIMVYIQNKKKRSPLMFFKDRFFRIVPLYWSLTLALAFVLLFAPNLFRSMDFSVLKLIKSLSFSSDLIYSQVPLLFVGWSLEYEMLFYTIFSISLLANTQSKSLLATIILIAFAAFYVNSIMIEFLFGIGVCWLYLRNKSNQKIAFTCLCFGFFLLGLTIWTVDLDALITKPDINRALVWGLPAALILYGAVNCKQLHNKYLIALGNASYSIYLIQIFTIPAFYKMVIWLNISFLNNHLVAILCLAATAYSGYLLHIYYETRIANLAKTWLK